MEAQQLRALLLTVVVGMVGCGPKIDPVAEEAAVREVYMRYQDLANARDAAGIAGLFLPEGALYWQDFPFGKGPAAVEAVWNENFAFSPGEITPWAADRFDVAASGDLAVEHGSSLDATHPARYVTVYRKHEGAWRVLTDISVHTYEAGGAPEWAREGLEAWYAAYNARDAEALAAYYASDAVLGDVRGRSAITDHFRRQWAERPTTCAGTYDGFQMAGKTAVGWGRDTCTGELAADGTTLVQRFSWLGVYAQQADGSWLCIRDESTPVGE